MTERWIPEVVHNALLQIEKVIPECSAATSAAIGDTVREAVGDIACEAFRTSERIAIDAANAAAEMASAVNPDERELHRRRALEGTRIAQSLAALRVSLEEGIDVTPELGALAEAVGATDHVLEGGGDEGGADSYADIVSDIMGGENEDPAEEVQKLRQGVWDVGPHVLTIRATAGVTPDLELLSRVGFCEVELQGPVRCVEAKTTHKGGQTIREITVDAAAIQIAAGMRSEP